MLTPQQLAYCADDIVELYSQLNESIVKDIARRIIKTGKITDTADWQARCLQESGMLYNDILQNVATYSGISEAAIAQLFREAAIESMSYDNKIYNAAGLNITISDAVKQTLAAGYAKTAGDIANLTRTTAVSTQQAFINACTLAELQVSSGAFSYQTAIINAIQKAASDGVYVIYPSGHQDRIEVAVRRNVLTGLSQTTGRISLMNADEMGCDLMEITVHAGARPSHASWQGQIVSRSGRDGYLNLSDIGYGTGDGFKGWNCRHDWYPYFEGISKRAYSDADLAALNEPDIEYNGKMYTEYDAEQRQRAFERAIRSTRSQLAGFNEAIITTEDNVLKRQLKEKFDALSVKLKRQESVLNDFCDKTGLLKQADRIQMYGFGRSVSHKAVISANNHFKNWSKDHNVNNIKTLADYYNIKYNDVERYALLKNYVKSVDRGMLSPLTGFDLYENYYNRVQNELVGLTTPNGITVKSQSIHFLERIFGTMDDPTHKNVTRNGVSFEDVKEALVNGKPKPRYLKDEKGNRIVDPKSISFVSDKCSVSVNPITGNLIQVSPKRKGG